MRSLLRRGAASAAFRTRFFIARWLRYRRLWTIPEWGLGQLGWRRGDLQQLPWITYASIGFIDQVVPVNADVLEIGGGSSTRWWTERGNRVTCLESDTDWAERIRSASPAATVHDVGSAEEAAAWLEDAARRGTTFDVVVVDGVEPRARYLQAAASLVGEAGILIVDNTDRAAYRPALRALTDAGWLRFDFFGLGPSNPYAWMTSVLSRVPVRPGGRQGFPYWTPSDW